jgi:acyl-coenzyme A synthetase/AMP-(fatty) acid ligase
MVERLGINQLYTAPTALRVLMKEGISLWCGYLDIWDCVD